MSTYVRRERCLVYMLLGIASIFFFVVLIELRSTDQVKVALDSSIHEWISKAALQMKWRRTKRCTNTPVITSTILSIGMNEKEMNE